MWTYQSSNFMIHNYHHLSSFFHFSFRKKTTTEMSPCIYSAGAIDTSHPFIDHTRAYQPLFDSMLLFDENVQVNGIQFFLDCGDVTMNFVTWAGAEGFSKSAELTNVSVTRLEAVCGTPLLKFGMFQLHSTFVTNPAEKKMLNIKQRHNLWIWKDSIPQHVLSSQKLC